MHRQHRDRFATGALAFALTVGIAASASVSNAASYGNFSDPTGTVSFLNVSDLNGLFGAPTVSVDSLDFSPNAFEADCATSATCPPTPHAVSDTLTLQIDANAGRFIERVNLSEAGDTVISTFLNAIGATTVVANVFIDVLELNGTPVNGINGNAQMAFTNGGNYSTSGTWTGSLSLDVNAVIAAAAGIGNATLVQISIANTITAYAESGAAARIEKKDVDGLAITVVPEPGTALLMGLGLFGLAASTRRSA